MRSPLGLTGITGIALLRQTGVTIQLLFRTEAVVKIQLVRHRLKLILFIAYDRNCR